MCRACAAFMDIDEPELERARQVAEGVAPQDLNGARLLVRIINAFEAVQSEYKQQREQHINDVLFYTEGREN